MNAHLKAYIAWAERQNESNLDELNYVHRVLTDKGQIFCNNNIEQWYLKKGIVHTKVVPCASQLNLVKRTH